MNMKKGMYVALGIVLSLSLVLTFGCGESEPTPIENDVPDVEVGNDVPDPEVGNDVPDPEVGNDVPDVAAATSMQYTVEWTNGETGEWTWMAKDMGTENLKLRWEGSVDGSEEGMIINGELRKIWTLTDGAWIEEDIPHGYWDMVWRGFAAPFEAHTTQLHDWTHGDWTYADPDTGFHVRIHSIQVNPDFPDSLFEP